MTARLFKRQAQLTVARPLSGKFFGTEPNATVVRDLRVQFEIEKTITSDPNTCTVTVDNLAERTRALFTRKPLYVQIDAGYDGHVERLFAGDLHWGTSSKDRATWETRLTVLDGLRALSFARVSRSFRGGVTTYDAVREASAAMGLSLKVSSSLRTALRAQYASGLVLHGRARETLDRVLAPLGADWSVQGGRLQILLPGEVRSDRAFLLTQQTGLIGSPSTDPPIDAGKPPVTTLKCLLYPAIAPGSRVRVQSQSLTATLRVQKVRHRGDTRGQDWTTEIEAIPT